MSVLCVVMRVRIVGLRLSGQDPFEVRALSGVSLVSACVFVSLRRSGQDPRVVRAQVMVCRTSALAWSCLV